MNPLSYRCIALYLWILLLENPLIPFAMQIHLTWPIETDCDQVIDPKWPFAYSKYLEQKEELKGRVSSNRQDVRHICQTRGVRSKCHICEDFSCGESIIQPFPSNRTMSMTVDQNTDGFNNSTVFHRCYFQLQGVPWTELAKNIPTVSDVPWAVGGYHRYDFGGENTTHVCMYLSGTFPCQSNLGYDYSSCKIRCWGYKKGWSGLKNNIISSSNVGWNLLNATPWMTPEPSVTWSYPKEDEGKGGTDANNHPAFLPQGYTFTLAGSNNREYGFKDGLGHEARFSHPEGVAVDDHGYVYVADTGNHAIRVVSPTGKVMTLAGTGRAGSKNGPGMFVAEFSSPTDVAVWRDWQFWPYPDKDDPDTLLCRNGNGTLVLFVADTGNHRIRKITGNIITSQDGELHWENVLVSCHSGLCSDDGGMIAESPQPGYADGSKHVARFDSPRGLTVSHDGIVFVADSNNHLIRMVDRNGFTRTVAGKVAVLSKFNSVYRRSEARVDLCPSNDNVQVPDYIIDGEFSFPTAIALGYEEKYLFVTDQHSLQSIDLVGKTVKKIAGGIMEGAIDGFGIEASFSQPESVVVTADNIIYISDSSSCRIRRISTASDVARKISCEDTLVSVFRPQGCTSYHPAVDRNNLLISPISGSIFYNYAHRNKTHETFGLQYISKTIKNCVGSPPPEREIWDQGDDGFVIDDINNVTREDPNEGTLIKVYCPSDCTSADGYNNVTVKGFQGTDVTLFYESSSICASAIYLSIIDNEGGLVDVYVTHFDPKMNGTFFTYSLLTKEFRVSSFHGYGGRHFTVTRGSTEWLVETISGGSVPVQTFRRPSGCGYHNAFPPQGALFNSPKGLGAFVNSSIDDNIYHLIVADRNNHAIRSISSVCSFTCENDGRCVGPNKCQCPKGWIGEDCSVPMCIGNCPPRHICIAPDTCSCIPGYDGQYCDQALCGQHCRHGNCTSPDTCSCASGWFDFQCGSPVCEQTCGNHGICIAPNECRCKRGWDGNDCRTPICIQDCRNGGFCVAPNTCQCTPDWTGYACQFPVCRQGIFIPFQIQTDHVLTWNQFTPCDYKRWCEVTQSFDCLQKAKTTQLVDPNIDEAESIKLDMDDKTLNCLLLEVRPDALSMFSPIRSWDDAIAPPRRYSSPLPFGHLSRDHQEWNEIVSPLSKLTQSRSSTLDRQIIIVEYRNIVQGTYACANKGKCVSPDVCSCAQGFIGHDCRTPVCEQGFYEPQQLKMTKKLDDDEDLSIFKAFLSENFSYNIDPSSDRYSNPKIIRVVESFVNYTAIERVPRELGQIPYLAFDGLQGGYSCSIRSVTQWENASFMLEHPNYYSRYMDTKVEDDGKRYTFWENMGWSPSYKKSGSFEIPLSTLEPGLSNVNRRFLYTDEGYRRDGIWSRTGSGWEKGLCIVEFHRMCSAPDDLSFTIANESIVLDTDISFRPRCSYDDEKEYCSGTWDSGAGGECVDHVKRGCFNNGTCVGPNKCSCSEGFMGEDCSIPICTQKCVHGNCTLPNQCTCEKGWSGSECSVPICAQECNNFGICSAPDTCTCLKWENRFRDGRDGSLYQTPDGRPQLTGWTGYDCSTPICVQAEKFVLNVNLKSYSLEDLVLLGGHGRDGSLPCSNVSCPLYDQMVTMNDGRSFQTGCGFDPLFTGCCTVDTNYDGNGGTLYSCYKCAIPSVGASNHSLTCLSGDLHAGRFTNIEHIPAHFKFGNSQSLKLCGPQHNPGYYVSTEMFAPLAFSSHNYLSNTTSDFFLCKRFQWEEGDYTGDRYIRVNYDNFVRNVNNPEVWSKGLAIPGEGIFVCYNHGSCIGPDICSCRDGYTGFDCRKALCRHKQRDGNIVGCLNYGECVARDVCLCPQMPSVLWREHHLAAGGLTGYAGSDCSIPVCVQGYYDPTCEGDLAIGGEGCYRCPNGGYCTKPDECTCAQGWTGFSCEEPVCNAVVTPEVRLQLMTEDDAKVAIFEKDPCGMRGFYIPETINGVEYYRGNCTRPNQCTCFCKARFDFRLCRSVGGIFCRAPFQDPFYKFRNVLAPNELFGTRSCSSGYEGLVDENDKFMSCHMTIYEPTKFIRHTGLIVIFSSLVFIVCSYAFVRVRTTSRLRGKRRTLKYGREYTPPKLFHSKTGKKKQI